MNIKEIIELKLNNKIKATEELYTKYKISKLNQTNSKIEFTILLAVIPYYILLLSLVSLSKNINIINFLSPFSIPIILTSTSLLIGELSRRGIYKLLKVKEYLSTFSTSTTERSKLTKELFYKIETIRSNNNIQIYEKILSKLDKEKILTNQLSKAELKDKIYSLEISLKDKYRNLDTLTIKNTIYSMKLSNNRVISKIIINIISSILITLFLILFPLLLINTPIINISISPILISTIISFTALYSLKRNNDKNKIINNLSYYGYSEIIPIDSKITIKELEKNENKIEDLIEEISALELELHELKNAYNELTIKDFKEVKNNKKTKIQPRGPIIETKGKRKVLAPTTTYKRYYLD